MKYDYDIELEAFVREDGLGKKIWINAMEGQRIMTLYELGNSIAEIRNKIIFNNKKVYESTIVNFIKNVEEGNIVIPTDVPAPLETSLTVEERIQSLEDRVSELESIVYREPVSEPKDHESFTEKLRGKIGL